MPYPPSHSQNTLITSSVRACVRPTWIRTSIGPKHSNDIRRGKRKDIGSILQQCNSITGHSTSSRSMSALNVDMLVHLDGRSSIGALVHNVKIRFGPGREGSSWVSGVLAQLIPCRDDSRDSVVQAVNGNTAVENRARELGTPHANPVGPADAVARLGLIHPCEGCTDAAALGKPIYLMLISTEKLWIV